MPFDTFIELIIGEVGLLKLLGVMKLVRVLRLSRMITYLRVNDKMKALLNLLKLVFYLIMYVHCFACVWYMLVSWDKNTWIPVFDYSIKSYWFNFYDNGVWDQYRTTMHSSMLLLTGNEVGPRTT